jgi:S-adenosylmethionine:tRNA ribosyltransferase-isomerase
MKVSDFDYHLPEELIAQEPVEPRDASRLLVVHRETGALRHRVFRDIIEYLEPSDVLVINDTKVIPARLFGIKKETGARVEVLLLRRISQDVWEVLVRPGRRVPPGTWLEFGDGVLTAKIEMPVAEWLSHSMQLERGSSLSIHITVLSLAYSLEP